MIVGSWRENKRGNAAWFSSLIKSRYLPLNSAVRKKNKETFDGNRHELKHKEKDAKDTLLGTDIAYPKKGLEDTIPFPHLRYASMKLTGQYS